MATTTPERHAMPPLDSSFRQPHDAVVDSCKKMNPSPRMLNLTSAHEKVVVSAPGFDFSSLSSQQCSDLIEGEGAKQIGAEAKQMGANPGLRASLNHWM